MNRSKKVDLIKSDLMKVGERHGTGKNMENVESFIWALALTLITYTAGVQGNNAKAGYKTAVKMLKTIRKNMKKVKVK